MNNTLSKLTLLVIVLAAAAATVGRPLNARRELQEEPSFRNLTFTLAPGKQEFVQLEPIPLRFELLNGTDKTIEAYTMFNLSASFVELFFRRGEGDMKKMAGLSTSVIYASPGRITIEPGESYEETHLLTVGLGEKFPRDGNYYVESVIYDAQSKEKLKSNTIRIRIAQPNGLDGEAFNFLKTKVNASTFFEGVDYSSPEKVEEFTSLFGDSAYGDYAVYLLGTYYWNKGMSREALKQFEKLSGKDSFIHAERVKRFIKHIRDKDKGE